MEDASIRVKVINQFKLCNPISRVTLTNYLKDGRLEIDNNKIENLIRPLALGRKNFLFMGSPQGAKAGAIFYSLIATCPANNVEPYKYFCTILHQIRLCKSDNDYRKLLPQFIRF